jgi:serine protease DegS
MPALPVWIRYFALPALIGAAVGVFVLFAQRSSSVPLPHNDGYADAVALAAPSVVSIHSSKVVRTQNPICQLPRFRELCERLEGSPRLQSSLGSGVVVRSEGYILTNFHVIDEADEILVDFFDGRTSTAEVIGTDPDTDLAVIKVNVGGLRPIDLGSSDGARVGDIVLAIGNPFGIGQTVSMGIVSAIGRYGVNTSMYADFIQTDAAINPGNSGGALVDTHGSLIGINSLIFSQTGGSLGIGFAIPAKLALTVLDEIVREGRVIRGWLGIEMDRQPSSGGLLVKSVLAGSPAAEAGIQPFDLIRAINGQPAMSPRVVTRQIAVTEPGAKITLDVTRNGEDLHILATAGQRPPSE